MADGHTHPKGGRHESQHLAGVGSFESLTLASCLQSGALLLSPRTLLSCSVGPQSGPLCMPSPISNESRLCSLKAGNRAPWAVIREKVFNTGQVATGGRIDWQIATWQLAGYHPPPQQIWVVCPRN